MTINELDHELDVFCIVQEVLLEIIKTVVTQCEGGVRKEASKVSVWRCRFCGLNFSNEEIAGHDLFCETVNFKAPGRTKLIRLDQLISQDQLYTQIAHSSVKVKVFMSVGDLYLMRGQHKIPSKQNLVVKNHVVINNQVFAMKTIEGQPGIVILDRVESTVTKKPELPDDATLKAFFWQDEDSKPGFDQTPKKTKSRSVVSSNLKELNVKCQFLDWLKSGSEESMDHLYQSVTGYIDSINQTVEDIEESSENLNLEDHWVKCQICNGVFGTQEYLDYHLKVHHFWQCPTCQCILTTKLALKDHIKDSHSDLDQTKIRSRNFMIHSKSCHPDIRLESQGYVFQCKHCNTDFDCSKSDWIKHSVSCPTKDSNASVGSTDLTTDNNPAPTLEDEDVYHANEETINTVFEEKELETVHEEITIQEEDVKEEIQSDNETFNPEKATHFRCKHCNVDLNCLGSELAKHLVACASKTASDSRNTTVKEEPTTDDDSTVRQTKEVTSNSNEEATSLDKKDIVPEEEIKTEVQSDEELPDTEKAAHFNCKHCNFTTKFKAAVDQHFKVFHSEQHAPTVCSVCCKNDFISVAELKQHLTTKHPGFEPRCFKCQRICKSLAILKEHLKEDHFIRYNEQLHFKQISFQFTPRFPHEFINQDPRLMRAKLVLDRLSNIRLEDDLSVDYIKQELHDMDEMPQQEEETFVCNICCTRVPTDGAADHFVNNHMD